MNKRNKLITAILTLIFAVVLFLVGFTNKIYKDSASLKYQVYLDGETIGLISDTKELYSLINQEQSELKDKYKVDQVYPPKGFEIEKYLSYDNNLTSVNDVYNKIKDSKSFTVKGYIITISSPATETEEAKILYRINVLDKKIFEESIQNFVKSFVSTDRYLAYINDEQSEIKDTGSKIESIYFNENITIKESYLNTADKIYTTVEDLTKFLVFGDNNEEKPYKVQKGDTIASISDANKLNPVEFLIANPTFASENSMLAVGQTVNVSLINPQLTLIDNEYIIEDTEVKYETEVKYDSSRYPSYKKVETQGQNGIQRVAKHVQIVNGEIADGTVIDKEHTYMLKEVTNEVVIRGSKQYSGGGSSQGSGIKIDTGGSWAWPTNYPYVLTSPYGWRWGAMHDGQDISGTGYGSPIYAIGDGVVRASGWGGMVGSSAGLNVVIEHPNGYWSVYAHLSQTYVKVGDTVSRKQTIGAMGHTGVAFGTHLHLGISIGKPYNGGRFINPLLLYR